MKKTLIIELILTIVFAITLAVAIYFWKGVQTTINAINLFKSHNDNFYSQIIEDYYISLKPLIGYGTVSLLALLADLAAMVLIAIKDFPVFKPLVEKLQAKSQARKHSKEQAKAARAEANKQAKIAELESQLEELKKD